MKNKQISVRLTEEEAQIIEEAAAKEELPVAALFRKAAKQYIENKNKE